MGYSVRGLFLTMALLLLLVTTALLAWQPIEGQDRLAAIARLKEAIVEAYPDKESIMFEVVDQFFVSAEAKSLLGECNGENCQTYEDCGCFLPNHEDCFCKCKGNKTCGWLREEELEMIKEVLAKDEAHLDENSLRLLEEIHEYFN